MASSRESGCGGDDEGDIHDFLLLTTPDDSPSRLKSAGTGSRLNNDMFESLLSSQHLMAAVLSHDHTFGSSIPKVIPYDHRPLPELISNGMATLMDETLIWHRFYLPLTPTLVSLRNDMLASRPVFSSATSTLFVLLILLALESPSTCLRQDHQLRTHLRSALSYYGEEMLLTLPASRHTLAALLLLFNYKVNALCTSQRGARLAIKSKLYITLAHTHAQHARLRNAAQSLEDAVKQLSPTSSKVSVPNGIESLMIDALQWCSILVYSGWGAVAGFQNLLPTLDETIKEMEPIVATLLAAMRCFRWSAMIIYHYACVRSHITLMRHCIQSYSCWESLTKLGQLIRSHEQCSRDLHDEIIGLLKDATAADICSTHHKEQVEHLVEMQLEQRRTTFGGLAIFFALVSSFRHRHKESQQQERLHQETPNVEPQQAIQIANDLISHFKTEEQTGAILDLTFFLREFGDDRDSRFVSILSRFANALPQDASSSSSEHSTAPWLPPPRRVAVELLYYAKILVENNAARLKGWNVLHPRVEEHLAAFAACADRLESMARSDSRSFAEAFADGCLFAASAKLMRSLRKILMGWKMRLAKAAEEKEMGGKRIDVEGDPPPVNVVVAHAEARVEADAHAADYQEAAAEMGDGLLEADFDELFTQWSDWPQVDLMDFARQLPDDTTFP